MNRLSIDIWHKSGTCLDFNPKKVGQTEIYGISNNFLQNQGIWVQSGTQDICPKIRTDPPKNEQKDSLSLKDLTTWVYLYDDKLLQDC